MSKSRKQTEDQRLIAIFTSGSRARRAGIALLDCPFVKDSEAWIEWRAGWRSVGTETDACLHL